MDSRGIRGAGPKKIVKLALGILAVLAGIVVVGGGIALFLTALFG